MHLQKPHLASGGRYPVLRALGILFLIGTAVAVVGGLVLAGWLLASQDFATQIGSRIVLAVTMVALTFFFVIGLLAAAEVLKLLMDIEYNTRASLRSPPIATVPAADAPAPAAAASGDSGGRMRQFVDEETAEAALLRGH